MSSAERAQVLARASESSDVNTLSDAFSLVVETLGRSELYIEDDAGSCEQIKLNMNALEQQVSYLFYLCTILKYTGQQNRLG